MIQYNRANQTQKDNFLKLITGIFTKYTKPEERRHYCIHKKNYGVLVVVKQKWLGSASLLERFQTILDNLKEIGLLECKKVTATNSPRNSEGLFPSSSIRVPALHIDHINTELTNILLSLPSDYIQRHMVYFSPQLQAYVKECLQVGLREEFELSPLSSLPLMSLPASPIGLTRRLEIPVKLPNSILGISKECYDLEELLKIPSNLDGTRNDPMTRQPFKPNQIIPAPDAFEKIKDRMLATQNDAVSAEKIISLNLNW